MSFEDVAAAVQMSQLHRLGRCAEDQERYAKYISSLKLEWESIDDFILCDKFNFEVEIGSDGKKIATKNFPAHTPILVLKPNDFPYCFESDVEHYCLWKLRDDIAEDEIVNAVESLRIVKSFGLNFIYFINPPSLRSVLDVSHAHIIIKVLGSPA